MLAIKKLLIVAAVVLIQSSSSVTAAEKPKQVIRDGERMLFIGNSYTANEGGVFRYLEKALKENHGPNIKTEKHIYYGQPLSAMLTGDVKRSIASKNFDTVVFTSGQLSSMKRFHSLIKPTGKKSVVFMTWEGRHPGNRATKSQYTQATKRNVQIMRQMEKQTDAIIAPVAVVYHDLTMNPPANMPRVDYLWRPGNIHQNELGTMVNCWTLYAILLDRSPVGVDFNYSPFVVGEKLKMNPDIKFDVKLRKELQQRVWTVVTAWKKGKTTLD